MVMSRLLDVAPVKENFQIVISKKMREIFDVKEGDFVAAFELDEYPDGIFIKRLNTTVEPVKKSR